MKRLLLIGCVVISLLFQFGCSLDDDNTVIDDEEFSPRQKKDYDIVVSVDQDELYVDLMNICKTYESKTGVRINIEIALPPATKSKQSYFDSVLKYFKNSPAIFIASVDAKTVKKSGAAMNLFESENEEFKKTLGELDDSKKIITNNSLCYGVECNLNGATDETHYVVVNSKTKELEKKLAINFANELIQGQNP